MTRKETTVSSDLIYTGKTIQLRVDTVEMPNKGYQKREIIEHKGAVAIVAITDDNKIVLVKQYRKAVEKELYELPAGKIEIGENPRIFTLESLKDRVIDMDMDQVTGTYADIKEGDFLVADTTGKLKVVQSASGGTDYKEYLKVIEKTTYNAEGLAAVVVIA